MNRIIKTTIFFIVGSIYIAGIAEAQEAQNRTANHSGGETITSEQLALLKANRAKQIEFRNAFRETLSGNQLDILTDQNLSREQKLNTFRQSLSGKQINMIKGNRKQLKVQRSMMQSTLSSQQRLQIRRMTAARFQMNRTLYRRIRDKKNSRI